MKNKGMFYEFILFTSLLIISFIFSFSAFAQCPDDNIRSVFCPPGQSQKMDSFIRGTNFRCVGDECKKNGISFPQKQVKRENFNQFVELKSDGTIWDNSPEAKDCVIEALKLIPSAVRTPSLIITFIKECKKKAGDNPTKIDCLHVEKTLCDLFFCCNMPKPQTICPPDSYDLKATVNNSKKVKDEDIKPEYRQR